MRRTTMLVACTLALALCAGYAAAQEPADTLKVDYFSNANTGDAPDGTFRITNPGTAGGNLCAAIYVFDQYQELSECCSCLLTPDGLETFSVNSSLTDNPLTGVVLSTGVIKVVSSAVKGGSCPYYPSSLTPTAGLRSWMTHIQNSNFTITETASQDATLSAAEVKRLQGECYAIQLDGSGRGRCYCGSGD